MWIEANSVINPGEHYFSKSTLALPKSLENLDYAAGENRVTIYSKFPFGRDFETCDQYTSVCSEVLVPDGSLIIYGTIIGVTGGTDTRFRREFSKQQEDIRKLAMHGNLCVVGDFNISFSGYTYPSKDVRAEAVTFFDSMGLEILTGANKDSPDHIAISKTFMENYTPSGPYQGPMDKKLSDHTLVSVALMRN